MDSVFEIDDMASYIYQSKERLNSGICKTIIKEFEAHPHLQVSGKTGHSNESESNIKLSTDMGIDQTYLSSEKLGPSLNALLNFLGNEIKNYLELYPFLNNIQKWGMTEKFNIQRYYPGQGYYAWHCEYDHGFANSSRRMIAWMIYLNTVNDGGTEFSDHGIVDAEEGKCVFWPAYWTHFHRGVVSQTDTKYIATGWYSFMD